MTSQSSKSRTSGWADGESDGATRRFWEVAAAKDGQISHPYPWANPRVFEFRVPEDLDTLNVGYLTFESNAVEGDFNEIYLNPPQGFSCQDDSTDVANDFALGFVNAHHDHPGEWFSNVKAVRLSRLQPSIRCGADGSCPIGVCESRAARFPRCANQVVFCGRDGHAMVSPADVDDFSIREIILNFKRDRLQ